MNEYLKADLQNRTIYLWERNAIVVFFTFVKQKKLIEHVHVHVWLNIIRYFHHHIQVVIIYIPLRVVKFQNNTSRQKIAHQKTKTKKKENKKKDKDSLYFLYSTRFIGPHIYSVEAKKSQRCYGPHGTLPCTHHRVSKNKSGAGRQITKGVMDDTEPYPARISKMLPTIRPPNVGSQRPDNKPSYIVKDQRKS